MLIKVIYTPKIANWFKKVKVKGYVDFLSSTENFIYPIQWFIDTAHFII